MPLKNNNPEFPSFDNNPDLIKETKLNPNLEKGYETLGKDLKSENEALEWCENLITDIEDE